MFTGLAMLAYRGSGQAQQLGSAPPLALLMLDPGQTVDTLTYNAQLDLTAVRKLAPTTQAALDILRHGLTTNDPAAIGAAATLSATSYQTVNYNPLLPAAQNWASTTGALGIVRAHSGSVLGLLYPPDTDLTAPALWLSSQFEGVITPTRLAGEGYLLTGNNI
jgi:L-threonine kinase